MHDPRRIVAVTAIAILLAACPLRAEIVEVSAGKHDRVNAIVTWPLPDALAKAEQISVRLDGDKVVPAQRTTIDGKRVAIWIIPGEFKAGETRSYTVKSAPLLETGRHIVRAETTDDHIALSIQNQLVLKYNRATIQPPQGVKEIFARGAYIHPVHTPAGLLITNDFPPKHLHHHGIWFPWTETVFEGKKTDFWNMGKGEGTIEFVKLDDFEAGNVMSGFRVKQKHVALKAAKGKTDVLNETWDVRVYGTKGYNLFDLTSTQTCAGESKLTLKQYHYGGLGVRGSADWELDACNFLTSEGLDRHKGHATSAKWCAMSGKIGKTDPKPAGIGILGHPSNFRAPQKMRLHPDEPFFNFAPEQDGDFDIVPGKPYVSRYRFVVFDGETDAKLLEKLWNDYAEPVEVKVK